MTTTAQAFTALMELLEPTDSQRTSTIPGRQARVVQNLNAVFSSTCDMPFWKAELIGSASKGTIIRPLDDIDVLAVFSDTGGAYNKYRYDSRKFLYRIREAYNDVIAQQVGARGQAVRIFFETGGHVDVAPVFWAGDDDYLLPAGDGSWIRTSPLKANEWFAERNSELAYQLRPVVRLLKAWNRAHSSRFKSFHLETMAASTFTGIGSNHRDALAKFFGWAQTRLSVTDPGGHSGDLSSYLGWPNRSEAIAALKSAETRALAAVAAEARGDHSEAKRLWRIVLGDDFPTT